jgi:hypothetical protein
MRRRIPTDVAQRPETPSTKIRSEPLNLTGNNTQYCYCTVPSYKEADGDVNMTVD